MTIADTNPRVDGCTADPFVSILINRFIPGWPPAEHDHDSDHWPLSKVLTLEFADDGHFAPYSRLDAHPRLKIEALPHVGTVPMVAAVFDVDCEASHKATGGSTEKPAPDVWFEAERQKLVDLLGVHPGGFVYRTRGGYRIVYRLPEAFEITTETQSAWTLFYVRSCIYLTREFGIIADPACSDWTHIYRVPHATRDRDGKPETLETIGDASNIGIWQYIPGNDALDDDITLATELGLGNATWRKRGLKPLLRAIGDDSVPAPRATGTNIPFGSYSPQGFSPTETSDSPDWPALPTRVARARKYVAKIPGAISGQSGHSATFSVAVSLVRGFALPCEAALDIITNDFNPRCQPSWSSSELHHKISSAAKASAPRGYLLKNLTSAPRPKVVLTHEEHLAVDQAVNALAADVTLFHRGGRLVRIAREPAAGAKKRKKRSLARPPMAPHIAPVPTAHLRERLTAVADIVKPNDHGDLVPAHPTPWLVQAVEARRMWPTMRRLLAIVETPILRPDGTIISSPGYDAETGLLFEPLGNYLPVPDKPTAGDVKQAVGDLLDVLSDFPFASDVHRAAAIAGILNPFFRFAYDGPTPAVVVDATTAATGKGLLVDVMATIATGRKMARMPQARDDAEESKRILAIALAGDLQVLIDNLSKPLGSGDLDAALTATDWTDRLLGKSEITRVPLLVQWYATGNNVQVVGDTARRLLFVRMESPLEHPEERTGFKYPNLIEHVTMERPKLVRAALTIGRAYLAAGAPPMGLKPWGSFEAWSDTVRNAVVFAGLPDPALTRDSTVSRADMEVSNVVTLVRELDRAVLSNQKRNSHTRGISAAEIVKCLQRAPDGEFCTAVSELAHVRQGHPPTARNIGYLLRKYVGRVVGGSRIVSVKAHDGVEWHVETLDTGVPTEAAPGDGGDGGDVSTISTRGDEEIDEYFVEDNIEHGLEHHRNHRDHPVAPVLRLRPIHRCRA